MSAELIFSLCNMAVLPGWLLLIFLPQWRWTTRLITSLLIPFVLGVVYFGLFISQVQFMPEGSGFGTVQEVANLFSNPYNLTAGWVHYLAFDLFVGSWEVRDARKQGINHFMVVPCLIFTFLLGPFGLVLYLLLRIITTKKFELDEPEV